MERHSAPKDAQAHLVPSQAVAEVASEDHEEQVTQFLADQQRGTHSYTERQSLIH
jgi:hypothetical protein